MVSSMTDERSEELDRLWRAIKRDLSSSILEFAGMKDSDTFQRLMKNWERLSELNPNAARAVHRGVEQVALAMGRHVDPSRSLGESAPTPDRPRRHLVALGGKAAGEEGSK